MCSQQTWSRVFTRYGNPHLLAWEPISGDPLLIPVRSEMREELIGAGWEQLERKGSTLLLDKEKKKERARRKQSVNCEDAFLELVSSFIFIPLAARWIFTGLQCGWFHTRWNFASHLAWTTHQDKVRQPVSINSNLELPVILDSISNYMNSFSFFVIRFHSRHINYLFTFISSI